MKLLKILQLYKMFLYGINLTSIDRINYQHIANQITVQWETYRIPATENYADELNATNLRGYLRDEVYAFEIVFLLKEWKTNRWISYSWKNT